MSGKRNDGQSSGRGQRDLTVRVKTAKGRKSSSTRWLQRQLNDPYVKRAQREGYRSRAAFKIMEIDDKFRFFVPGAKVVDLGCAPGGWCQVAVERTNSRGIQKGHKKGFVLGIDIQEIKPIQGCLTHNVNFLDSGAYEAVKQLIGDKVDVVMSDMAAASSGHRQTDHLRVISLCEAAAEFSFDVLAEGGAFISKVLAGGAEGELQKMLKKSFGTVANVKPPASRSDSAEKYVVAIGYRGR